MVGNSCLLQILAECLHFLNVFTEFALLFNPGGDVLVGQVIRSWRRAGAWEEMKGM